MKVYDAASLRNVALVGHSGSGKTQLVSALLFDAGAVNRLGKVDDGTTVTDYDEEEIARKHTLVRQPRLRRVEQDQDQLHRHAGHRQLPQRRARRAARRRRGAGRRRRACTASRCRPRRCGTTADELGAAAHRRAQPPRSRARQPRPLARVAARRVRPHGHPDPAADRRGEGLRRRRRPRRDEGVHVRQRRQRQADRRRDPRRHDRDGERGARGADRNGRRGRRRADGEVLRRRHADARRSWSPGSSAASRRRASSRWC